MKAILTSLLLLNFIFSNSQSEVPINITVLNFDSIPYANADIIVENLTNKTQKKVKTDAKGKVKTTVKKGASIQMKYKVLSETFEYESFNVPTMNGMFELDYLMQYKLPAMITLSDLFYDSGKASIRQESYSKLDELAQNLLDYPNLKIEIIGHTDNVGSDEANLLLSKNRAKSVVDYLTTKGVPTSRLSHNGYGESRPIADNDSETGRQINRRTEIRIL